MLCLLIERGIFVGLLIEQSPWRCIKQHECFTPALRAELTGVMPWACSMTSIFPLLTFRDLWESKCSGCTISHSCSSFLITWTLNNPYDGGKLALLVRSKMTTCSGVIFGDRFISFW